MRIRPNRICTITLLNKIFPSSYYIFIIRPRNRSTTSSPLSNPNEQSKTNTIYGTSPYFPPSP